VDDKCEAGALGTRDTLLLSLLRLSGPILVANIFQTACQTVDMVWVGRLDTDSVAAVAACYPIIALVTGLYAGLLTSSFVMVAQYCGARDRDMVDRVAAQSLILMGILAIAFSFAGSVAAPYLLRMMGINAALIRHASAYLQISLLGLGFVGAVNLYGSIMRGVGAVRAALCMTALGASLNIVLDPVLIFGVGPIHAQGLTGAAYATLISQAVTAAVALSRLYAGRNGVRLRPDYLIPDFSLVKRLAFLGAPASFGACIDPVALLVFTGIVASFGTLAVAVNGVALKIFAFSVVLQQSMSTAVGILVGAAMGAGDVARARSVGLRSTWTLFAISIVFGVLVFAFAAPLVSFFVPPSPALIDEGARAVRWMALSFGFVGAWLGLASTFTSAGDTLFPMAAMFVIYWTVEIPVAWGLSKHTSMGTEGLWATYPLSSFAGALVAVIWFRYGRWKRIDITGARSRLALRDPPLAGT
jgi:putative MATE family efflux protein